MNWTRKKRDNYLCKKQVFKRQINNATPRVINFHNAKSRNDSIQNLKQNLLDNGKMFAASSLDGFAEGCVDASGGIHSEISQDLFMLQSCQLKTPSFKANNHTQSPFNTFEDNSSSIGEIIQEIQHESTKKSPDFIYQENLEEQTCEKSYLNNVENIGMNNYKMLYHKITQLEQEIASVKRALENLLDNSFNINQ